MRHACFSVDWSRDDQLVPSLMFPAAADLRIVDLTCRVNPDLLTTAGQLTRASMLHIHTITLVVAPSTGFMHTLASLPQLRTLRLQRPLVLKTAYLALADLTRLTELQVCDSDSLSSSGSCLALVTHLPLLRVLAVIGWFVRVPHVVAWTTFCSAMGKLELLELIGFTLRNRRAEVIDGLKSLRSLHTIWLDRCEPKTTARIVKVARYAPRLAFLGVRLNSQGIKAVSALLPKIALPRRSGRMRFIPVAPSDMLHAQIQALVCGGVRVAVTLSKQS